MDSTYSSPYHPQYSDAAPPPPPHSQQQQQQQQQPQQQYRMHPSQQPGSSFPRMQHQRQYTSNPPHPYYNGALTDNDIPLEPQRPLQTAYHDRHMTPSPPMHPGMGSHPPSHQTSFQPWGHDRRHDYRDDGYRDDYGHDRGQHVSAMAAGAATGGGAGWAASHMDGHQYHSTSPADSFRRDNDYALPSGSDEWEHNRTGGESPFMPQRRHLHSHASSTSQDALTAFAAAPALNAPAPVLPHYSDRTHSPNRLGPYRDSPGQTVQFSRERLDDMVFVDPHQLAEDGDLGLGSYNAKRNSRITLGRSSNNNSGAALSGTTAAGVAAGALAGGLLHRDPAGGKYGPVPLENTADFNTFAEKTALARDEARARKKKKIVLFILGVLLILGIIAATVIAIIVSNNKKSASAGNSQTAAQDDSSGDLSKDSAEIKKLMSNSNLHKVFQGMAYTPFAAQYPACLTNPPSQNNITRDMAVMSQLTNTVRLYGTDCNQTEMVLHAIDRLAIPDMKIWLGVWLGNNDTTNTRQIAQTWKILDQYGTKQIKGLAVGNEVLYRKDITESALATVLSSTKTNLTTKGYGSLPVATSDLGDNWTAQLASEVDVVMSNIHPFFAGITADAGAAWAINFWNTHDTTLTTGTSKGNIISEIGWPSQGGNDCGAGTCTSSTQGSVAGISQMNTFLNSWVCQALANGTDYFWFEAFDEPWKIAYNTPGKEWEDHWGLFDINRNLKSGLKIPDCGGKTVS